MEQPVKLPLLIAFKAHIPVPGDIVPDPADGIFHNFILLPKIQI